MYDKYEVFAGLFVIVCSIIFVAMVALIPPIYEAKAFNGCTGSHATYMDALFTELRVTECKK